jgi:hypothetical protein
VFIVATMRRHYGILALLLVAMATLLLPARRTPTTWRELLAPFERGVALPHGFRVDEIRRGVSNDVEILAGRESDGARVVVRIVERGRWSGIRESASFGIAYETLPSEPTARDAITALFADAIRAHDPGGLPSPGAIPLHGDDGAALSPAIEALRGGRAALLGLSAITFGIGVLLPRPLVSGAALLAAAALLAVRLSGAPLPAPDLSAALALPLAVVLFALAGPRLSSADARRGAALGGLALALRAGLGVWGPLHVNGYGPLFVVGAARDPAQIGAYGPGYAELFAPLAGLAPAAPDWAIFAANAFCSALAVVAAFAVARALAVPRGAAALAALLLALDPVSIHMAASESYFPISILVSLCAGGAVLLAARRLAHDATGQAALAIGAAALLAAAIARLHPTTWGLIAAVPCIALAAPMLPFAARLRLLIASAAMIGGGVLLGSGAVVWEVIGHIRGGMLMRPSAPPALQALLWVGGAATLYAVAVRRRGRIALPAALALASLLLTRHAYAQSWLWQQSYDRLYLTLPLIAALAIVPTALLRPRWARATLALAIVATWIVVGLPIVRQRTTDQLEYAWVRRQLAPLPEPCRVIYVGVAGPRGVVLPTYAGPPTRAAVAIDAHRPASLDAALAPAECLYYVRSSVCASAEGAPECAAVEQRLTLEPVAETAVTAVPSARFLSYDRDPVPLMLARARTRRD